MAIRNYLLILLDSDGTVPEHLELDRERYGNDSEGNAVHVSTGDLIGSIQGWGAVKIATMRGAAVVRAVALDTYDQHCEECKSSASIRDFKVCRPQPSLHVEEI